MKTAIAIRHVAFEDAGTLADVLASRGVELRYLDAGIDDLAAAKDADLLIVLGGPIGIYEVGRYPFLKQEFAAVEAALKRHTPLIGIGLGAQAIAATLGSRVYPGRDTEIGWGLISLSAEGRASPLAALRESRFRVLHWHGDTFDLPGGARLLAETAVTPNQAFAYRSDVLALQFHVEPRASTLERWLIGYSDRLAAAGIDLAKFRADTAIWGASLERASVKIFNDWLDAVPSR